MKSTFDEEVMGNRCSMMAQRAGLFPGHRLCSFSGTCELIVEQHESTIRILLVINALELSRLWRPACLYTGMADRVLIIDDDDQLIDAYRDYLSESGYQVDCAQELEEAQTLLAHFSYSVVITDLRLSKLAFGGLDLVKHVRESSLQTRIIVLTAYGWPELKAEASAVGSRCIPSKADCV